MKVSAGRFLSKRLILLFTCMLCAITLYISSVMVYAETTTDLNTTVYITQSGEKYHRDYHYEDRNEPVTINYAVNVRGFEACEVCNPPELDPSLITKPEEQEQEQELGLTHRSGNGSYGGGNTDGSDFDVDDAHYDGGDDEENSDWLFPGFLMGAATIGGGIFINRRGQENKRRKKREEDRAKFIESLNGRSIRTAAGVPSNVYFYEGLPKDNNNKKYGSYTKYLSKSGNCYHDKQGCCSAKYPAHAFRVANRYKPCSKCCRSTVIIPNWYEEYERLEREASRLEIDKNINVPKEQARRRVVAQLNVTQVEPKTKQATSIKQSPSELAKTPVTKPRQQSNPEFAVPKTKPAPSLRQEQKKSSEKFPATVEIPERKTKLRMVSFDINSNGLVEGKLDGKPVTFNSVWGKHTFTEEEIIRLLNNQAITFQYTTKKGKTRTATGKLGYGTGKYANHFGFQPEDF